MNGRRGCGGVWLSRIHEGRWRKYDNVLGCWLRPSTMSAIELEDTIVGRWEYRDGAGNPCVKGTIEEPIQCPCAVYYNTRFREHPDGYVIIDGVAGFDARYEKAPFRWIRKPQEKMLVVGDWERREGVPASVFGQYADHVFYMRDGEIVTAVANEDDIGCLPYYRYPRTKDGPKIPELVMYVLGVLPSIVFVEKMDEPKAAEE